MTKIPQTDLFVFFLFFIIIAGIENTDYSELFLGIMYILGFFSTTIILFILFLFIMWLRERFCLKRLQQQQQQQLRRQSTIINHKQRQSSLIVPDRIVIKSSLSSSSSQMNRLPPAPLPPLERKMRIVSMPNS